jgi:two-component system sensor histidine kinase VanS
MDEHILILDDARSADTGGAGLGLAIAKEIVALHGGALKAECGAGRTTFTVVLPIGKE